MYYPLIIQPRVVIPILPGDHERRQRGCVDGEEHHGEEGPHRGHEPRREGPGAVHVDRGLEEEGPHHPVGAEQGKLVVGAGARLK